MKLVITTQAVRLGDYRASHADFLSDYGSAPSAPARPNCTCAYERNVCHASQTPGAQRAGGPRIWPEGDAIIAALPTLLTKQTAPPRSSTASCPASSGRGGTASSSRGRPASSPCAKEVGMLLTGGGGISRDIAGYKGIFYQRKVVTCSFGKKRCNAGLRGFKEHGALLPLKRFKKRLKNV